MDMNEGIVRAHMNEAHLMLRYETQEQFTKVKAHLDKLIEEQGLPLKVNMPEFDNGIFKFIEVHVDEERIIHDVGMMLYTDHGLVMTE